jgi:cytochrome c553
MTRRRIRRWRVNLKSEIQNLKSLFPTRGLSMRALILLVSATLVAGVPSPATAQCRVARRVVQESVVVDSLQLTSGLTVVPFAVPVAVPVATVSRPTIFYGYGAERDASNLTMAKDQASMANESQAEPPPARQPEIRNPKSEIHSPDPPATGILRLHCARCHSGPSAKGDLMIFDEAGQLAERLPRQGMLAALRSGKMPPPDQSGQRQPLTEADIETLSLWAIPPRTLRY